MTKYFRKCFSIAVIMLSMNCSNDDAVLPTEPISVIIQGASITPQIGGPNQPNQVYVDLSTGISNEVRRDTWDLGFYSGAESRVIINGSIFMAAAALSSTNIDEVTSETQEVIELQPEVAVGTFNESSLTFIDNPNGDILSTALNAVDDNDENNPVYLINLGDRVGSETPPTGSVNVSGEKRGWAKIRVLKRGEDYVLHYAKLDDTTHNELVISKTETYNFTFFSFDSESTIKIQPEKSLWDINFTVFTNEISGFGAYGFTDFVTSNIKSNVGIYMINEDEDGITYDLFSASEVDASKFITNDQRAIGSSWRNGGGPNAQPSLKTNVFYIVNDTDGNVYKLKFLAMTNEVGERGHPEFVYAILN